MDDERRSTKDGGVRGEAGKDRGGVPTHTGDENYLAEILFTCPRKTYWGPDTAAERTEGKETRCCLSYGRYQWVGIRVGVMGPRETGFVIMGIYTPVSRETIKLPRGG